jgi:teichuronic acid biosynthesis glycosyltransferase TuaG
MKSPDPLVSVVLPCYNAAHLVGDAIRSVVAQTYSNWELVAVDDGSSDGSWAVLERARSQDTRVRAIRLASNGGVAAARNAGIDASAGELVAFLDCDDVWLPRKLSAQIEVLEAQQEAVAVYSAYYRRTAGVERMRKVRVPGQVTYERLLSHNVIGCSTAVYRVSRASGLRFHPIGHEDFAFWLDLLRTTGGVAVGIRKALVIYCVRGESLSSNKLQAARYTWELLRKRERLGMARASWHFVNYAARTMLKRVGPLR